MPKDGFSIMTVMIGSVVVAALAVVYMQKARNKAQVAAVTDIIAYRDYVFRYYTEVASNRMAWPCTLKANPSLQTYVQGGGAPTGPHNLQLQDVSGNGCVVGAGTGKEVIPDDGVGTAQGLGLKLYTNLPKDPVETYDPDQDDHHIRVYATWEGLGRNAVRVRLATAYNYKHERALTSFKIEEKEMFIYMNRHPARNCSDGLAAGFGFFDDGGTGSRAPLRYFGDTAVTSVDAKTRLVTCWEKGPLVIPPCYDLLETADFPNCPGISDTITYAGMCPKEGGFRVPALAGFKLRTGETICEKSYGLILGDRVSHYNAYYCGKPNRVDDPGIAFQGINSDHAAVCSPSDWFGIKGGTCLSGYAGWHKSDGSPDCHNQTGKGFQGPPGVRGLPSVIPALPGPAGDSVTCDCIE